jgi:hypothetical protein
MRVAEKTRIIARGDRPRISSAKAPNAASRVSITYSRSACDTRRRPRPAADAASSSSGPVTIAAPPRATRRQALRRAALASFSRHVSGVVPGRQCT